MASRLPKSTRRILRPSCKNLTNEYWISLSRHYFGDELKADCFLWITAFNRLDIWLNVSPKTGSSIEKQFHRLEDYCRVRRSVGKKMELRLKLGEFIQP